MPIVNGLRSSSGLVLDVFVGVSIYRQAALRRADFNVPQPVLARALLDSGASCSAVDPAIIRQLAVPPTGRTSILTPSTGAFAHECDQYDIAIAVLSPHNVRFTVPAVEVALTSTGVDVLLGRDVLDQCLFVYNGPTGAFSLALG
jgi:hypothetical protein